MSHQETCHLLTVVMRAVWWLAFPATLTALIFCAVVLTYKGPRE